MTLLDPIAELEFCILYNYEDIKQEVKPCTAEVTSKTPGWYPGFGFECLWATWDLYVRFFGMV